MKQIKFLILGVIGMIAFTATATTTAKLEKKQNVELVTYQYDAVTLVNEIQSVVVEVVVQPGRSESDFYPVAIIGKDVGWFSPELRFSKIPYKEKLLENYNLNFIQSIRKQSFSIRSDC